MSDKYPKIISVERFEELIARYKILNDKCDETLRKIRSKKSSPNK